MAASRVVRPSRQPTSASQKVVRPTANPMKPGTPAAVDSQDSTFASSSPRPRMMQPTPEQPSRLAAVHIRVALRVVAHEDLAEGGRERLDVARVVVAVLEVELVLAALLRRDGGEKATRPRVAEDHGAELFVDEDTGARFRHATSDGGEETLVDDRLRRRDPLRLLGGERALPAAEARLEGPAG